MRARDRCANDSSGAGAATTMACEEAVVAFEERHQVGCARSARQERRVCSGRVPTGSAGSAGRSSMPTMSGIPLFCARTSSAAAAGACASAGVRRFVGQRPRPSRRCSCAAGRGGRLLQPRRVRNRKRRDARWLLGAPSTPVSRVRRRLWLIRRGARRRPTLGCPRGTCARWYSRVVRASWPRSDCWGTRGSSNR